MRSAQRCTKQQQVFLFVWAIWNNDIYISFLFYPLFIYHFPVVKQHAKRQYLSLKKVELYPLFFANITNQVTITNYSELQEKIQNDTTHNC